MSEMRYISCDGCGEIAPADHSSMFPRDGWMMIRGAGSNDIDVCGERCLDRVVGQLVGRVTDADLEQLIGLASDTAPKPRQARKPRGSTAA